jgi:phosphoglycolate phosphatase-like HAD superfamily hydrolase
MVKTNYLIFDFDGVLGDTKNEIVKALQNVLQVDEQVADKMLKKQMMQNPHLNSSDNSISLDVKNAVLKEFTRLQKTQSHLFVEFIDCITKIPNTRLAVVTSSLSEGVEFLLNKESDLEFDYIRTSEDNFSKVVNVNFVLDQWGIKSDQAYFFTDTVSDVLELKEIFINRNLFGCSWGYHDLATLLTVLSQTQILTQFKDIQQLF